MVIWIAGLSGAGKSTVCRLLFDTLKQRVPQLVLLDGDVIREAFGNDLGYTEEARIEQVKRVQRLARLLSQQDLVVLVALVYTHPDLLSWNRRSIPRYFEVFLNAPLDLVRRRDSKGLYGRATRGETTDVVGHDIPWFGAPCADLVLDVAEEPGPETLAAAIATAVPELATHWKECTSVA